MRILIALALMLAFTACMGVIAWTVTHKPTKPKKLTRHEKAKQDTRDLERENAELDRIIDKIRGNK
ncbi:hypothetical protein [Brevibacterium sediminis]|uniref:Uncharacterized protein n=1 Tax=Brevibacterium sediminis TaxID=1857024 RepID=A0A5C4X5Q7_9MICO|nr:hypothetical protein [Brevibacterium sediminis]TNM55906.1 hypothetical protein FHQ09_06610 [Brevibacterium sediminis]